MSVVIRHQRLNINFLIGISPSFLKGGIQNKNRWCHFLSIIVVGKMTSMQLCLQRAVFLSLSKLDFKPREKFEKTEFDQTVKREEGDSGSSFWLCLLFMLWSLYRNDVQYDGKSNFRNGHFSQWIVCVTFTNKCEPPYCFDIKIGIERTDALNKRRMERLSSHKVPYSNDFDAKTVVLKRKSKLVYFVK